MQRALGAAVQYDVYLARAAALLALVCTVSVFLYGSFLLLAVAHTAARTDAQKQISLVSSHLNDLEGQYLSATKQLTPERAAALGFVSPAAVATVFTSPADMQLGYNQPGGMLSLHANE